MDPNPLFDLSQDFLGEKLDFYMSNITIHTIFFFEVLRANNLDNMEWWMDVVRECSTPTSPNPGNTLPLSLLFILINCFSAATDFPIVLPRYIDSVISQSEFESCRWFTTFMTRYFKEMQQSSAFGDNVKRVITKIIDKLNLKRPKRLVCISMAIPLIEDANIL